MPTPPRKPFFDKSITIGFFFIVLAGATSIYFAYQRSSELEIKNQKIGICDLSKLGLIEKLNSNNSEIFLQLIKCRGETDSAALNESKNAIDSLSYVNTVFINDYIALTKANESNERLEEVERAKHNFISSQFTSSVFSGKKSGPFTYKEAEEIFNTYSRLENDLLRTFILDATANFGGMNDSLSTIESIMGFVILFLILLAAIFALLLLRNKNKLESDNRKLSSIINEKERAEEYLRQHKTSYRATLDRMVEGVQIIGTDWRYIYLNNSVVKQAHYTKEELLGYTMMEKYPGIEHTELFSVLERCMIRQIFDHIEYEFTFPDGEKGWFELSVQPVPEGLFIVSIDITERKLAEEKLRKENERLLKANTELSAKVGL